MIYDGEYVFCINVYYKDKPECKIKICYVSTPLKSHILLEELTNMGNVKYITNNLEKSITFNNSGTFDMETLKNYYIQSYNHETTNVYDFTINGSRVSITHTFMLIPIELAAMPQSPGTTAKFIVSYKFITYQHVKN